jgi:cation:H+ antiporter
MIALSFMVLILGYDGRIGQLDGLLLTIGLATYTSWAIIKSRKEQADVKAEYEAEFGGNQTAPVPMANLMNLVLLIVGLGMLILGSRWLVSGAITIARDLGISELVIGLTIVAAGTSLPEVATSIMAAIRGERDIAVGNVVGSNLFNIMGVLGISSLVSAGGVAVSEAAYQFDIPVMVAVAVACLPIFFTGHVIARWEGGLFLAYYVAYTASIIVAATVPAFTRDLTMVMLGVVVPLTVITLLIGVVRSVRNGNVVES